jgi:DNA primase
LALIPATTVAEIRDRTDIVAIVAEHVPLRRTGTNYQGLCPFHQEKSPSFTVSAAKQFFYCFGCQKSGDVFRFLMDLTGRSFVEVAEELAARAGVIIPEPEPQPRTHGRKYPGQGPGSSARASAGSDERARLLRLNELTTRFFEAELKRSEKAQRYLQERGVSPEMAARFRLGYAPSSWDALLSLFAEKRVPHELAEQAGLLIRREGSAALPPRAPATSATHYDRFRDRIIFPLLVAGGGASQTALGDVVAFGGRMMPSEQESPGAKYINSPETPIYKKGDHLFGLHSAREAIRKQRQVILVEGNFDVIALQQHGFDNTVAPMGTALTETQVRLLSRLIGEDGHVVLMLDGDRAGRSATIKDIFLFSEANLRDLTLLSGRDIDVRVARLPDGEDPDTFAKRDAAGLLQAVRAAQPAVDYVLDETIAQAESTSVSGRARVLERVAPLLIGLKNRTAQAMYVDRVASALNVRAELLWQRLTELASEKAAAPPARSVAPGPVAMLERPAGPAPMQTSDGARRGPAAAQPPFGREQQSSAPARTPTRAPAAPNRMAAPTAAPSRPAPAKKSQSATDDALALSVISLIADHPKLLPLLDEETLDSLENPVLSELLRQAREEAESGNGLQIEKLIELAAEETRPQVAAAALAGKFVQLENPEHELDRISRHIRARAIQREVQDLTQQLVRLQRSGDQAAQKNICQRILELNQLRAEILALKNGQMVKDLAPIELDPTTRGTVAGDTPR